MTAKHNRLKLEYFQWIFYSNFECLLLSMCSKSWHEFIFKVFATFYILWKVNCYELPIALSQNYNCTESYKVESIYKIWISLKYIAVENGWTTIFKEQKEKTKLIFDRIFVIFIRMNWIVDRKRNNSQFSEFIFDGRFLYEKFHFAFVIRPTEIWKLLFICKTSNSEN